MRAARWLFAVAILVLATRGAAAQARPQGTARSMRDALPERVVQRMLETWKQRDVDGAYAYFDTVFTHERLGDPSGVQRLRRDDLVRQTKADTGMARYLRTHPIVRVRTDVFGPFVNQVWTYRLPNGTEETHFELFEVRGGKIVREIEG